MRTMSSFENVQTHPAVLGSEDNDYFIDNNYDMLTAKNDQDLLSEKARMAKLKCNATSNAGASTTPNSIHKESSDKFVDDTMARISYSPAKESMKRSFSDSDSVTDPQQHVEKEQKKFATLRMSNRHDLTNGDDYDYGDVTDDDEYDPYVYYGDIREFVIKNFVPPPINLSLLKGSDFSSDSEYESESREEDRIDDTV